MPSRIKIMQVLPIVLAMVLGTSVAVWPPIRFTTMGAPDFASRLSVLLFFSLLIERTVEIFMSIWRSEQSNRLQGAVRRLIAVKTPHTDPAFVSAHSELIKFRAETIQWTMPLGFALGLLISACGVRALSQFVEPASIGPLVGSQQWWFNVIDIAFTGALLAGGADPIHKILDLYRKFMESSASVAAGTRQQ